MEKFIPEYEIKMAENFARAMEDLLLAVVWKKKPSPRERKALAASVRDIVNHLYKHGSFQ